MQKPLAAFLVGAGILAGTVTASAQARSNPPDGRASLLDPEGAFWSEHAPEVFRARFETTKGAFVIEAHRTWAPRGVDRLYNLVRSGFFDDSRFYRVIPKWIVQFGIPGDPKIAAIWRHRAFPDDSVIESNRRTYVSYAMTGPDQRTTQLYISRRDNVNQDAQGFAPIGRIVEGMAVVDSLYDGYGETSGGGMRAGRQAPLFEGGNAYLDKNYPKLDRLIRAQVVRPD